MNLFFSFFFFFSGRRRHTRYIGDWCSDVCSSDLPSRRALPGGARAALAPATSRAGRGGVAPERAANRDLGLVPRWQGLEARRRQLGELLARTHEIGRASCREWV